MSTSDTEKHLTAEEMVAFDRLTLTVSQAASVYEHLLKCGQCSEQYESLRRHNADPTSQIGS